MDFYAIERLYEILQKRIPADPIIRKKFNPKKPWWAQIEPTKYSKRNLIKDEFDIKKKADERFLDQTIQHFVYVMKNLRYDPRLIKIYYEYDNIPQFFVKLFETMPYLAKGAYEKVSDQLIAFLFEWDRIMKDKVEIVKRTGNEHLANLTMPEKADWFPVKVMELNAMNTMVVLHPLTKVQYENQIKRPTKDLLKKDETDPMSGYRVMREGDKAKWASSMIYLRAGHHRAHEIYSRYLQGKIDGETLIEFKEVRET